MPRELFEFYCSGGCQGYIQIPLDIEIDADVILVCPKCKHQHMRRMKNGRITETRHSTSADNEITHRLEPTLAAYSEMPKLRHLEEKGPLGQLWGRLKR